MKINKDNHLHKRIILGFLASHGVLYFPATSAVGSLNSYSSRHKSVFHSVHLAKEEFSHSAECRFFGILIDHQGLIRIKISQKIKKLRENTCVSSAENQW